MRSQRCSQTHSAQGSHTHSTDRKRITHLIGQQREVNNIHLLTGRKWPPKSYSLQALDTRHHCEPSPPPPLPSPSPTPPPLSFPSPSPSPLHPSPHPLLSHSRVLITTDVWARGIDVQTVSLVINYDLPNNRELYIHRSVDERLRCSRMVVCVSAMLLWGVVQCIETLRYLKSVSVLSVNC